MSARRRRAPSFSDRLLRWFEHSRRDLPWRRRRDPYAVLVSEVMLQQTTVAAAAPRFDRFVARFPDWATLAAAPVDDVVAEWAGLGYYRRARNLHAAARTVVAEHGGAFPRDPTTARALPGVGRYTVGAVLSLAHGTPLPAVDGNVARVFSRHLGRPLDAARSRDLRELEAAVTERQPADAAGPFNEALMELGATVCTPRAPSCLLCPVGEDCVARRDGRQEELPPRRPQRSTLVTAAAALVVHRERVLLRRRPDEAALLAGLWELPGGDCEGREPVTHLRDVVLPEFGGGAVGPEATRVRHAITHRRITLHVHACTLERRPRSGRRLRWVAPSDAPDLGLTTATHRALEALEAHPPP